MPSRVAWQMATPLRARDTCSNSASVGPAMVATSASRAAEASANDRSTAVSSWAICAFSASIAFFFDARSVSACFDQRGQLVAFEHPLQHLLLGRAQVLLRGLDLVLHRLVLAVGLDRRQLVLEFGQPALVDGRVLLDDAPLFLAGFEVFRWPAPPPARLAPAVRPLRRCAEGRRRSSRGPRLRWRRAAEAESVLGALETLTPCLRPRPGFGGPARIRTWDQPIMSRPL